MTVEGDDPPQLPGVRVNSPLVEVDGVDQFGQPRLFTFGIYQAMRLKASGIAGAFGEGFTFFEFDDSPWIAELLRTPGIDEETRQLLLHARHWMVTAGDDLVEVVAQEMKFAPLDDPVT